MAGKKRHLVAAGIMAATASSAGLALQVHPAWADDSPSAASQLVADINALRAAHGVAALSMDSSLVSIAAGWSSHLAAAGTLSHNPALAASAPAGWRLLGENVGVGPSVAALQQAFTNSPEHYANMVDPRFNTIGVSVDVTPQGYLWVTEDYMETPAAAAAPVVAHPAAPVVTVSAPVPARPATAVAAVAPASAPVAHAVSPAPAPSMAAVPVRTASAPAVPDAAPAPSTAAPASHPAGTTTTTAPASTPVTVRTAARAPHAAGAIVPLQAARSLSPRSALLALALGLVGAAGLAGLARLAAQLVGSKLIRPLAKRPAGAGLPSR